MKAASVSGAAFFMRDALRRGMGGLRRMAERG